MRCTRMTTRSLRTVVTDLGAAAGLELSPQALRHTARRSSRAGQHFSDLARVCPLSLSAVPIRVENGVRRQGLGDEGPDSYGRTADDVGDPGRDGAGVAV
jgi:hypothetical protein